MDVGHGILLLWTAVIFWVAGQIWFAQLVVYPLFAKVGPAEYTDYHRSYGRWIPGPVIVPGFASFLLPVPLMVWRPADVPLWSTVAVAVCGVVGLLVTVALEIPRHARLERNGKEDRVIRELIAYNWIRTVTITLAAVLTLGMLARVIT